MTQPNASIVEDPRLNQARRAGRDAALRKLRNHRSHSATMSGAEIAALAADGSLVDLGVVVPDMDDES